MALTGVLLGQETTFALDEEALVRLLGATVLGGLVGLEREASDQAAGLRTHIAVALGASLFGVISTLGFLEYDQARAGTNIQADVSRVAGNVVVGIGFVGAGVIFRQGNTVRNLTTAASLWTVAAIGLACGVGDVTTAAIATAVLLVSLVVLRPVRTVIRRRWATRSATVRVKLRHGAEPGPLLDSIAEPDGLETSGFGLSKEEGQLVLTTTVAGGTGRVRQWMAQVAASPDVTTIDEE